MIADDIRLSQAMADAVGRHAELELVTQALSITTFRYVPRDLRDEPGRTGGRTPSRRAQPRAARSAAARGRGLRLERRRRRPLRAARLHRELPHRSGGCRGGAGDRGANRATGGCRAALTGPAAARPVRLLASLARLWVYTDHRAPARAVYPPHGPSKRPFIAPPGERGSRRPAPVGGEIPLAARNPHRCVRQRLHGRADPGVQRAVSEDGGLRAGELRTLTYRDLTPENWHAFEADIIEKQVLVRGHSELYQKEYRRKDGTVFPIELRTVLSGTVTAARRRACGRSCVTSRTASRPNGR